MAETTGISWCDATFNPWRGCTKVCPGCAHCYADRDSKRNPGVLGIWGPSGTRVIAAESYWQQPLKWNRVAKETGARKRVFCASLADIFEGPETMPEDAWPRVRAARVRLHHLINETPNLDWLLLTKRPENIREFSGGKDRSWTENMPPNVWLGVSVENQKYADARIGELLRVQATVHFLSMEPLLGAVDLTRVSVPRNFGSYLLNAFMGVGRTHHDETFIQLPGRVRWVVAGGESGGEARPMHPAWVRSLRDQCVRAKVAFHLKQWGEMAPLGAVSGLDPDHNYPGRRNLISVHSGVLMDAPTAMFRVGRKNAGRMLDGREWNEFPDTYQANGV